MTLVYAIGTILILMFVLLVLSCQERNRISKEFSSKHGFKNTTSRFFNFFKRIEMEGKYDNYFVNLYQKEQAERRNSRTISVWNLYLNIPKNINLKLKPEFGEGISDIPLMGSLIKKTREAVKEKFKVQDIITDDEKFDESFLISGEPEEMVKTILSIEIRKELYKLLGAKNGDLTNAHSMNYFSLLIEDNTISLEIIDDDFNFELNENVLKFLRNLAFEIENY